MTNLLDLENQICIDYNDYNISGKEICERYNINFWKLEEIRLKYNLPKRTGIQKPYKYQADENYFEIINTPAKAYFVGFIAGDGYIKDDYQTLDILLKDDDCEILELFKKELNSNHLIYEYSYFDKRTSKTYYNNSIKINRSKLCYDLEKCNVGPNKSFDLKMPTNIPDDLMCHYIRGIVDSDGCWCSSYQKTIKNIKLEAARITFNLSVYSFAEELQQFLMKKCNLNKTKIQIKTNKLCVVAYVGNIQCKRIYDYLYGSGGPWLQRKFKKVTELFLRNNLLKEADIPKEIEIKESESNIFINLNEQNKKSFLELINKYEK